MKLLKQMKKDCKNSLKKYKEMAQPHKAKIRPVKPNKDQKTRPDIKKRRSDRKISEIKKKGKISVRINIIRSNAIPKKKPAKNKTS